MRAALHIFLLPASWALLAIVKLRALAYRTGVYRRCRLNGTVISVGNLTVGGTGKTPMALWLAERLAREGKIAGVLMRGYAGFLRRRRNRAGIVVRAEQGVQAFSDLADEARLLLQRLQSSPATQPAPWLGIGANRCALGRQLAGRGVRWFVLDDGFQHWQLARDVDIVLMDSENPVGNGHLLPAGRLREPPSALQRADIVVITHALRAPAIEAMVRRHTAAPIFYAQPELDAVRGVGARQGTLIATEIAAHRFFMFCGIGNPSNFFADARQWGLHLCGERSFPDHHRYSDSDAHGLIDEARRAGATALLCTEKDACNFGETRFSGLPVFQAQISLRFPDEDAFWSAVMAVVGRKVHGAGH